MLHALTAGTTPAPTRPLPPSRRKADQWAPDTAGPYRLPRAVHELMTTVLRSRRNRDEAYALAVHLSRNWTTPERLTRLFPVDRRALAKSTLGLSEGRVRGALDALVEVGFLDHQGPKDGKRYRRTEDGWACNAVLYRFGDDYALEFMKANASALAARRRREGQRRAIMALPLPRPVAAPLTRPAPLSARPVGALLSLKGLSQPLVEMQPQTQLSHNQIPCQGLFMGEQNMPLGKGPESPLEAALLRFAKAIDG